MNDGRSNKVGTLEDLSLLTQGIEQHQPLEGFQGSIERESAQSGLVVERQSLRGKKVHAKIGEEKVSRPPWARMLKIHEWIQGRRYPNCVRMAAELETSTRTLKRDIEFMRD